MIGPVSASVLQGESIYRVEDLLFFNRLTEKKLPEETYHSWNYVRALVLNPLTAAHAEYIT